MAYEKDEIIIDNTELLGKRADVELTPKESFGVGSGGGLHTFVGGTSSKVELTDEKLGGLMEKGGEEERKLWENKKRVGWHEPSRKLVVAHVCPVCGTHFTGRRNRIYCSPKCKEVGKKRKQRTKQREIRDFKPHVGTAGEVYFMATHEGKEVINFVPAFNATSLKNATKYINDHYPEKMCGDYIEQVKEVIKK